MADRYVNYDQLLEERRRLGLDEMSMIHKVNAFNQFIDHLPTADVVEVVRCKDCIYNEIGSCTHSQKYDEDNYRADYFCADGTPKERGGEK